MSIAAVVDKAMSEEATGLSQRGEVRMFTSRSQDTPLTDEEAKAVLAERKIEVEIPNAGAGFYAEFAERMGLGPIQKFDTSSSAGDWVFKLVESPGNFLYQRNRYPGYGFAYCVGEDWESWGNSEMEEP